MSEESDERNSVERSQRVIRGKNETPFGRNILDAEDAGVHVHVIEQVVGKLHAGALLVSAEYVVYLVLMDSALEITEEKTRNPFRIFGRFLSDYLLNIDFQRFGTHDIHKKCVQKYTIFLFLQI